jgi:RHS repeat-associated protein
MGASPASWSTSVIAVTKPAPSANRRVYVGDGYERQTATDGSGAFTRDLYKVYAGGRQVAQVQRETRAGATTETRRYIHADHLGSSQLITDEEGHVASLRRFNAFGELSAASTPDAASASIRSGFTGHETDVETGLVNMRGRIYDPKLARFLQADIPFSSSPLLSQGRRFKPFGELSSASTPDHVRRR